MIDWSLRPGWWVGSWGLALFAAYVALDLSRGVLSAHRPTAMRALAGAALALSTGMCAAHFVAMSGSDLPMALNYDAWQVFGTLVLAYLGAAASIAMAVDRTRRPVRGLAGTVVLGATLCAAPVLALVSLELYPSLNWQVNAWLAGAGGVVGGVGLAWYCFSRCRRAASGRTLAWQAAAAVPMGTAMWAANGLVIRWVGVPWEAMSPPSAGSVNGETLFALASLAVPSLLALLLLSSVLESRFKAALRRAREELQVAAQTDPLTSLPNRTMFETWLLRATMRADRQGQRVALLFINLDGLKTVNESLGQAAGDAVLCEMGKRLRSMAGSRDIVARAGGDEFLMLLEGNPSPDDSAHLANRLLKALNDVCVVDEREVTMSCSVGIASYPEHGAQTKLIPHAAAAMHAAKRNGGATYCVFEPRMVAGVHDQVELLRDLRRAIQHRELELYYQPKIHAASGQITGAEALMRWHHPKRGMVGPHIFIPLAEKFGLIQALGNWLIEDVCRQIRDWGDSGLRMRVALNLSVHQLRQEDLVDRIAEALARHEIDPHLLTCEITESAAMEDTRTTLRVIERLSAAGVHLSIDDFGTGYSSLSYLRQLAAEELKIDRSFVLDLETSADARAIVSAVVKLAQALGLKVVAEGVETEAQQKILCTLGCDELQGFLFAKPMSAKALTLWAMKDEGPRSLDFRPSLFDESLSVAPR
ncbi:bifunctional diguanylate cyclase/phosphodiesterase [Rhizobacter sp. Root1221]|uniref:putative bifunctional diguanylate cyclase/phosphodiesterase n=1 Tax=Rhizobacter sp. Root1221 TaxID=1736433 RepID=UPI0006F2DC5A|nr:EAL domain-containing protein [Rhizobacter sp. Root1221]KQV99708.1 hypothetical protein ASC87_03155 [Rhizobacter sp. Root1221]